MKRRRLMLCVLTILTAHSLGHVGYAQQRRGNTRSRIQATTQSNRRSRPNRTNYRPAARRTSPPAARRTVSRQQPIRTTSYRSKYKPAPMRPAARGPQARPVARPQAKAPRPAVTMPRETATFRPRRPMFGNPAPSLRPRPSTRPVVHPTTRPSRPRPRPAVTMPHTTTGTGRPHRPQRPAARPRHDQTHPQPSTRPTRPRPGHGPPMPRPRVDSNRPHHQGGAPSLSLPTSKQLV